MFELQNITYFTEGNSYTGSQSDGAGRLLRYRVAPDQENQLLLAWHWQEDKCFELAAEKQEFSAPLSDQGSGQVRAWLEHAWKNAAPGAGLT